ncbi:MAG: SpoIIE family protein phosphatase [Actinobacteria bacterium]|nr:SpoIIE family protein phosphatase [Actinomycetota bacterium]
MRNRLESWRGLLPRGSTLPDEMWWPRHRGIVILLWLHALAVPIYALIRGFDAAHVLLESVILPVAALVATYPHYSRRLRTATASLGLLTASAILVHLSGGLIEMHFHFFVMVSVVALYQDWIPFLAAVGYVLVHHGVMGAIAPASVFNHDAARNHPWRWAAIHAMFIGGISAASLVTWRLNELALDQRRRAEDRLREESKIVETLHDVGRTLAAELDLQTVVQRVTDAATQLSEAAFGAFFYNAVGADGESYVLYTISGVAREEFSKFPMPRNTAIFAPTFTGDDVMRLDDVTEDPRYGNNAPYNGMPPGHLPVRSYLAVPVRSRSGEVLGGLFFGHPDPGRFTAVHERIVVGVASHAAVAIDNARLYESERQAREAAETARRRLVLLAEASRVLTSSLDVDRTLGSLTRLVVPEIADSCVVYLTSNLGLIEQAVAYAGHVQDTSVAFPPIERNHPTHPVALVMRSGESMFLPDVGADLVDSAIDDDGQRALVHEIDPTSAVIVPIVGRDEPLGALALGTVRKSGRRLAETDVDLAEELARRAGVAVEHARLYAEQRDVAETLQHSLLPDELPIVPGIETAARYVPGGPGVEIGGDWYDVIAFPDGTLAVAMGDVVGRGVPAASLMGQLRNALRAYAFDGCGPADLLGRLNNLAHEMGGSHNMATLAYAVFDPESSALCLANAGHPPPLIRTPDGRVTFAEGGLGPPLGAVPGATFSESSVAITPGSTVVLYTDGLVEDRNTSLDDGLARIRRVLADAPDDLESLCDRVMAGAMAGRDAGDDAALLALRTVTMGADVHLTLPARPAVLRPLRTALRRWLVNGGASEQEAFEILVAAGEACANAIQHAGWCRTSARPGSGSPRRLPTGHRCDGSSRSRTSTRSSRRCPPSTTRRRPPRRLTGAEGVLYLSNPPDEFKRLCELKPPTAWRSPST